MKVDQREDSKFIEEGLIGDQLTIERCINAVQSRKNGYNAEERLEGFHYGVADWHAGTKACTVSLYNYLIPYSIYFDIYILGFVASFNSIGLLQERSTPPTEEN